MTEVAENAASQIRGERPGRKRGTRRSWPCPMAASSRSPASAAAQARVDRASSGGAAERRHDLQDDEQQRVVAGSRRSQRGDVEQTVDVRSQSASGDLGDDDEERERRQPTPG